MSTIGEVRAQSTTRQTRRPFRALLVACLVLALLIAADLLPQTRRKSVGVRLKTRVVLPGSVVLLDDDLPSQREVVDMGRATGNKKALVSEGQVGSEAPKKGDKAQQLVFDSEGNIKVVQVPSAQVAEYEYASLINPISAAHIAERGEGPGLTAESPIAALHWDGKYLAIEKLEQVRVKQRAGLPVTLNVLPIAEDDELAAHRATIDCVRDKKYVGEAVRILVRLEEYQLDRLAGDLAKAQGGRVGAQRKKLKKLGLLFTEDAYLDLSESVRSAEKSAFFAGVSTGTFKVGLRLVRKLRNKGSAGYGIARLYLEDVISASLGGQALEFLKPEQVTAAVAEINKEAPPAQAGSDLDKLIKAHAKRRKMAQEVMRREIQAARPVSEAVKKLASLGTKESKALGVRLTGFHEDLIKLEKLGAKLIAGVGADGMHTLVTLRDDVLRAVEQLPLPKPAVAVVAAASTGEGSEEPGTASEAEHNVEPKGDSAEPEPVSADDDESEDEAEDK